MTGRLRGKSLKSVIAPIHDRRSEQFFELLDRLRQRGLADLAFLGRTAEMHMPRERRQILQLPKMQVQAQNLATEFASLLCPAGCSTTHAYRRGPLNRIWPAGPESRGV